MAIAEFNGDTKESSRVVRKALGIEPVDVDRVPKWVFDRIKLAVKSKQLPPSNGPLPTAGDALGHALKALEAIGNRWHDHLGTIKHDGRELLVAEPYAAAINLSMLTSLEKFVEIIGAKYRFSAASGHYPGQTVRIIIEPKAASEASAE